MPNEIRRDVLHVETVRVDGGRPAKIPLKLIAAIVVIKNPWAGRGFVENLKPEIRETSTPIGALLSEMIVTAAGSAGMTPAIGARMYNVPMHPGAERYFKEAGAL